MKIIIGAVLTNWEVSRFGAFENRMAYVLGLEQLGHEVYLIAEVDKKRCYDSNYQQVSFEKWKGRYHFEKLTKLYGIWPRCCLIYNYGEDTHGMSFGDATTLAKTSDLLVNINGRFRSAEILENVGCRAYIDLDPSKTQVYHSVYDADQGLDLHDYFFTVGLNIGTSKCDIPTCGLIWRPLMHPVVLDLWPVRNNVKYRRFTTISSWAGKETFDFKGRFSGEKSDQWLKFVELPKRTGQEMEIALKIHPAYERDIRLFRENGWTFSDPQQFGTLEEYRQYITSSRAEFSIANNRYVQFNTGWLSDRSARYLASGKPILVQSTGIEDRIPTGKGLLTFRTMEEAVLGIEAINSNYKAHCRAAREIAEEYFDGEKVLSNMLKQMGL